MDSISAPTRKLLKMLGLPTVEEFQEELQREKLIIQNAHPMVVRAMTETDDYVRDMLRKNIDEKSSEARNALIDMVMDSQVSKPIELLTFISEAIVNEFGNKESAIEFAMYHMNETKDRLVSVFEHPFKLKESNKADSIILDFASARKYIESLETFQTAFLIDCFVEEIPNMIKEANQKILSITKEQKFQIINEMRTKDDANISPTAPMVHKKSTRPDSQKKSFFIKHRDEILESAKNYGKMGGKKVFQDLLEKYQDEDMDYVTFMSLVKKDKDIAVALDLKKR